MDLHLRVRTCQRCGRPLLREAAFCPRCYVDHLKREARQRHPKPF